MHAEHGKSLNFSAMSLDALEMHVTGHIHLLVGHANSSELLQKMMKENGHKTKDDVFLSLIKALYTITDNKNLGKDLKSEGPARSEAVRTIDLLMFGTAPAENVNPENTPYKGVAARLEVGCPNDRAEVYNFCMKIRQEILDAMSNL